MERASERRFPLNAHDYKLYEEVGEGVSATVYRALCVPLNEIVAIKALDLEKCNNDLVFEFSSSDICNDYHFLSSSNFSLCVSMSIGWNSTRSADNELD